MIENTGNETDTYWTAIQMHNGDWDGRLFYGVKTTGIYCRPSCPSKRPTRSSVVFFSSSSDAEEAGFRACKRCHPDQLELDKNDWLYYVGVLEDPSGEISSVQEWAKCANASPARLRKIVSKYTGMSPKEFLIAMRMDDFKKNIQAGENITTSQFSAGFGSSSRLYEKAAAHIGMTPGKYKKKGVGLKITYSVMDIPIGKLLIAATEKGVCSIQMGDSEDELVQSLRKEFSMADLSPDTGGMSPWIDQLNRFFSGSSHTLDMPLELHATTFQLRVWHELRKIPYGETRSYSQVAEALGQPTATRAVAAACAANPVALATPCHRVIHSDGSVSGYRWGLEKKKELLTLEKMGNRK